MANAISGKQVKAAIQYTHFPNEFDFNTNKKLLLKACQKYRSTSKKKRRKNIIL
jgi:hypothetical protein